MSSPECSRLPLVVSKFLTRPGDSHLQRTESEMRRLYDSKMFMYHKTHCSLWLSKKMNEEESTLRENGQIPFLRKESGTNQGTTSPVLRVEVPVSRSSFPFQNTSMCIVVIVFEYVVLDDRITGLVISRRWWATPLLMETLLLHTHRLYTLRISMCGTLCCLPWKSLDVFIEFEERNIRDVSVLDI